MAKSKQKYYVVWNGHNTGIYETWEECQKQIHGFAGARYKSFPTLTEAQDAFQKDASEFLKAKTKKKHRPQVYAGHDISWESISVDAACSGKTGKMEYRGVWTGDGAEIFRKGPFEMGTNNVGEFLALVHAIAYLKKNNMEAIPIYTDSRTALSWVKNKRVKTTLKRTKKNDVLFQLMERAIRWLRSNTYQTKILKWDTANWGEIPADFGRK